MKKSLAQQVGELEQRCKQFARGEEIARNLYLEMKRKHGTLCARPTVDLQALKDEIMWKEHWKREAKMAHKLAHKYSLQLEDIKNKEKKRKGRNAAVWGNLIFWVISLGISLVILRGITF